MVAMIKRSADGPWERVKLVFHHVSQYTQPGEDEKPIPVLEELGNPRNPRLIRGHTMCALVAAPLKAQGDGDRPEEEVIDYAVTYCSHLDNYSREAGREKSFAKLRKKLTGQIPGESIGVIWTAYKNRRQTSSRLKSTAG